MDKQNKKTNQQQDSQKAGQQASQQSGQNRQENKKENISSIDKFIPHVNIKSILRCFPSIQALFAMSDASFLKRMDKTQRKTDTQYIVSKQEQTLHIP